VGVDPLVDALKVLSSGSRLRLLGTLRTPKMLDEISLPAAPGGTRGLSSDRPASRQAVQRHLDMLLDAGLVRREAARKDASRTPTACRGRRRPGTCFGSAEWEIKPTLPSPIISRDHALVADVLGDAPI
jgi:DNA-binding transcriptional ArsR family regulator